jgi:acetyltransferase-like isoleucine patch superfamily enzyme
MTDRQSDQRFEFLPWEFRHAATDAQKADQKERQNALAGSGEVSFGDEVYVAESAGVYCSRLVLGDRVYIGGQAYVTGDVEAGADSTINPFAVVRGRITLGAAVRVGAHSSLLAFNHGFAPDQPVFRQPHTSKGISVGDDVWIGSNVTVLDGVTIGSHAVIGAGAVVTRDIPEWGIAVGNPARVVRDRRDDPAAKAAATVPAPAAVLPGSAATSADLPDRLARFADRARDQTGDLLARAYDGERFLDRPGQPPTVRAWCDAIEISDLLRRRAPDQHDRADLIARLRAWQDPHTGLTPDGDLSDEGLAAGTPDTSSLSAFAGAATYHILCVGYALHLLGSSFAHPIHAVDALDAHELERQLDALPWSDRAWSSGNTIDGLGTACLRNMADFGDRLADGGRGPLMTLMGWLAARVDPGHGMWSQPDPQAGWLQVVNGFYRLTRGTYAQFGLALPHPEQAVRTTLAHARDARWFTGEEFNACNVLDVVHPLWLAGKQTDVGRADGERWAAETLDRALALWVDGEGIAFAPVGTGPRSAPGLQGTEMWLSVTWLLADYLGHSDALGYRPRGVHRPEPALRLPVL